jgi:hypothetical protein
MKTRSCSTILWKLASSLAATLIAVTLAGCGKQGGTAGGDAPPPANAPPPAAEAILKAWEQGDSATAIRRFLEADWTARPLFARGSVMSLSEEQFKKLPAAQRDAKAAEVQAQLAALRKLAGAVTQAGRDAAAKQDLDGARKYFTALQQCGQALDAQDAMLIVKLVGQALQKMAVAEQAKLPQ